MPDKMQVPNYIQIKKKKYLVRRRMHAYTKIVFTVDRNNKLNGHL